MKTFTRNFLMLTVLMASLSGAAAFADSTTVKPGETTSALPCQADSSKTGLKADQQKGEEQKPVDSTVVPASH